MTKSPSFVLSTGKNSQKHAQSTAQELDPSPSTYLIVEELVIRDRFKELLHGDEEASGSSKNDGHKQGDAQPQKLTLINHFHFLFGSWCSQSFTLTCINA